jgi:hypothetical protein
MLHAALAEFIAMTIEALSLISFFKADTTTQL